MKLFAVISLLLLLGACGPSSDGDAVKAPDGDDPAAATDTDATIARQPPPSRVAGVCDALTMEDALAAKAGLESFGLVGAWTIYGDENLACSEVYLGDKVECELRDGGVVVLEYAPDVIGFRNASGALATTNIDADGVTCAAAQGDG